jgi:UDP-N-acetylglucosamine 1-carboxyvinyltransferase
LDSYHIIGGKSLEGEHHLQGAKNAVLPILAATIVTCSTTRIENCPDLSDVRTMVAILVEMGCKVHWEEHNLIIDSSTVDTCTISKELMQEIRSSVFLMGPTLGRCNQVILSNPGGCAIGQRPIDIHLSALRLLGVEIDEEDGLLQCKVTRLIGTDISLPFPSVGATENVMMAAVMAEGETRIRNAAKEPEIVDLQNYLISCGADIQGAGTEEIRVKGKQTLHGTSYRVISDRIEAGTLLAAAAVTGGKIHLHLAIPSHMSEQLDKLREAGCQIREYSNSVSLIAPSRLTSIKSIITAPYPGFPTDMQPQFVALISFAQGTSLVTETIFENRFKFVEELKKMGADITLDEKAAVINGVNKLRGAKVSAKDLRGGAALVIAGLAAEGLTIIENICQIDRGYDKLESTLCGLGADIKRIKI